ncbi:MAG: YifB family Mg chelatase-like AAA ATPase [Opitutales bacterium]|nr:YifB family Mg chelatase-like AAA ATPase [Opitutales bacterium]MCH8540086.1 YifB family Mg chelatase-like AAA ATPase [Opitutales bacterium]
MLATIQSAALQGIDAVPVQVEVNTEERGEPKLVLVGLPDAAVKESDDRVVSALGNSQYKLPHYRTTINLAPGDIRKEGPIYDLPIALGLLAATKQMSPSLLPDYVVAGELGLSGEVRPIRGALAMASLAKQMGKKGIILPFDSAAEAALVDGLSIIGVRSLQHAQLFLDERIPPPEAPSIDLKAPKSAGQGIDFSEIKGQANVRRAVEIAVSGGHNLLMVGPPGSGKSMIAKRIPTVMPEPKVDEFLELLRIYSAAGHTVHGSLPFLQRPHRAPHHTISDVGLLGGGSVPGPGEVSLAHHGVLFLDELPEFKRSALEVLRQPLEDGEVTISRSAGKITLPCQFMLVAALNPCPCGYLGDPKHECRCTPTQIQRYRSRISGPLLDRIDLHVEAPAVTFDELRSEAPGESSAEIKKRVEAARERQRQRMPQSSNACNARMSHRQIREFCRLDKAMADLLQKSMEELSLSARAYDRVLKVARTIADLEGDPELREDHLFEAINYRTLDRNVFY